MPAPATTHAPPRTTGQPAAAGLDAQAAPGPTGHRSAATLAGGSLPALTVGVLALLTAVAPLAMDIYLPVLPALASELGASASQAQLTLTTFLAGLAVGQLVIGPLSDRWGRRGLLVAGTVLCLVASVVCATAPTIGVLLAGRLLQGFGGAAGVVLSRAVVVDRVGGVAAARLFATMMAIQGVAPVVAPLLGGALGGPFGWRGLFVVLAGLAALMLVGALVAVPESLPVERRGSGGSAAFWRDARHVVGGVPYLGYTVTFAAAFAAMMAYVAASPFVLQTVLGLSVGQYSIAFAVNAAGIAAVSVVSGRLVGRVPAVRLLGVGVGILVVASALLVAVVVLLDAPRWPTLALLLCAVSSLGLVMSNGAALATGEAAHRAGTGSAVMGALQFALAAAVSPLVGLRGEDDALLMTVVMLGCGLVGLGALRVARGAVARRETAGA